jgi:hypothetical protein
LINPKVSFPPATKSTSSPGSKLFVPPKILAVPDPALNIENDLAPGGIVDPPVVLNTEGTLTTEFVLTIQGLVLCVTATVPPTVNVPSTAFLISVRS